MSSPQTRSSMPRLIWSAKLLGMKNGAKKQTTLPAGRVPRISRLMALAIRFEGLIQRGEVTDYAELARLTKIMNMLNLAPDIERSKFKDLLPTTGGGSRGARLVDAILFNNGAVLKFMSGGGSDKSRAGFTARVVVITETDGMDKSGITSRESDKVTQLEARTRAYGGRRRVYMECTVSTERGRTWQEYSNGTKSNLMLPCPCCGVWVLPEREQLAGWQGAESQAQARELASFACPSCGSCWDDAQRIKANLGAKVVHEGQAINVDGAVVGNAPATDTLGFR